MFVLYCKSRVEWLPQKSYGPRSRKYSLSGPSQRKFVNSTLNLGGSLLENRLNEPSTKTGSLFSGSCSTGKLIIFSGILYHHAYTTTLQSMKTMLGITSRILGLPTWPLSAPSPHLVPFYPCSFIPWNSENFASFALEALFLPQFAPHPIPTYSS